MTARWRSVGTRRLARLAENIGAAEIAWTPNDLREIETASTISSVQGARYPERLAYLTNRGSGQGGGQGRARPHAQRTARRHPQAPPLSAARMWHSWGKTNPASLMNAWSAARISALTASTNTACWSAGSARTTVAKGVAASWMCT